MASITYRRLGFAAILLLLVQVAGAQAQVVVSVGDDESFDPIPSLGNQVIRERYPNGKLKVEREITLDSNKSFINHGFYRTYTSDGTPVMEGTYSHAVRIGDWVRLMGMEEIDADTRHLFRGFSAPFFSHATFDKGKLQDVWSVLDSKERPILTITFKDGQRDGVVLFWYDNGAKRYEAQYDAGVMNGPEIKYDRNGEITSQLRYVQGRPHYTQTKRHKNNKIKSQLEVLGPKTILDRPDDWARTSLATYRTVGESEKHGTLATYYASGARQCVGKYENNAAIGRFTWWHENDVVQIVGDYVDGKPDGVWLWRYPNGVPAARGRFVQGVRQGEWLAWDSNGQLKADVQAEVPVRQEPQQAPTLAPAPKEKPDNATAKAPIEVQGNPNASGSQSVIDYFQRFKQRKGTPRRAPTTTKKDEQVGPFSLRPLRGPAQQ